MLRVSVHSSVKLINIPKKNYKVTRAAKSSNYVNILSINYSSEYFSRTSSYYHIRFYFLRS